ncbi:hypothetical protein CPG37_07135 [Malaciobacter canalis]|uniref:Phage tail protein n=1 Tax=Malaciobacter canalis TaxID=1912871 RepID=A0ABX4LPW0_9BACT|nr:phage tail protein [Malaciobacter canalis]PHO09783.1 hypothetical protein CPG37_07135 [Malaciobacter canalis]QEE33401.1 phage tail collar fiber protein [Malaciobacter canalis]
MEYFTLLTQKGSEKVAAATAANTTVNLTYIALGDGNGTVPMPDASKEALVNEVYRAPLNELRVDENNANWLVAEGYVPSDEGNFWVREVGIFDSDGDLIIIGNYPETFKPITSNGVAKDLYMKVITEVSSADAVTLQVDPSVVMASQDYVNERLKDKSDKDHNHDEKYALKTLFPLESTDNAIARFDRTSGKLKNSKVLIDDNGNIKQGLQNNNINTVSMVGLSLPCGNLFARVNGSGLGISDNVKINGDVNSGAMKSCSYSFSSYATAYQQSAGKHVWFSAPYGSKDSVISFNKSMELSNTGVLSTLSQGELIGIVASSLVENGGYIKYSNGFIEQWGFVEDTWTDKTFPIAFPNKCFNVIGVDKDFGGGITTAEILSASQFRLKSGTGASSGQFIFYRAIGN